MDVRLELGRSLDYFTIGESLRNVMLAMQCMVPKAQAIFLYECNSPVLNDIYIIYNVDCEGCGDSHRGRYLVEFDPFLQVVRAVNYNVTTQLKPNTSWKISGSCDIVQPRPLTAQDFMSVLGDPLKVFTVPQGQVLKLLYDGLCLIFKLDHPVSQVEDMKLESHLTDMRLIPTKGSQFRRLVERTLRMDTEYLSLYGIVQIGLVIEEKYDQVVGINVAFPPAHDCNNSLPVYSKRVYFGQSCQCVMASLGAPDFVYYQQMPKAHLILPHRNHSKLVPQQFVFNYRRFGLDVVFDVDAKEVKRFIFHSNLPDHVDVNMYDRCFYKFGITKTGFAKKGQSFLVHPGVTWSTVTSYVTEPHVKFLSKIHRNDSTNALYPHPLSSVWKLFDQLVCEVTNSDYIATISLCSVYSNQQLGILGWKDEGLLAETSFQETLIVTEDYMPNSLSSVDDSAPACSSDVKISLPEEDGSQPPVNLVNYPRSFDLPSTEPQEESVKSFLSESSEMFHSLQSYDNQQDDERGKSLTSDCLKSHIPYAYPFQAYYPTRANQMSPCSNNILITHEDDTRRESHDIEQCQFVHIQMFTEGADITTCEEASDHILVENDKWRISYYSKEEQEAIDAMALREQELQAMQQQSLEENFVCDSLTTIMVAEQPHTITDNGNTTIDSEFEETESNLDQEWPEYNSHGDENSKEDVVSSDAAAILPLESDLEGSVQARSEIDNITSKDVTDNRGNDTLEDGNDVEEDKETETELVYKPQSAKMAASRTQGILKTVTSRPKKRGEHQPKVKKTNTNSTGTATTNTTRSHDQQSIMKQSQVIPKTTGAKVAVKSKSPSTVRVDHRKVHFYTEEKSKAITAKLKPKESTEVVRRAHKDGSSFPRHHFKSNQLSALLHQGNNDDDKQSNFAKSAPSTSTRSTFNRIFADGESDKIIPKVQGVVKKLNAPFATEYNSTVYSEITDGDLLVSSDDQTTSQNDQTVSQDNQTASQEYQTVSPDDQTTHQNNQTVDQTTDQDSQTTAGQAISEDYQITNPDNEGVKINDQRTYQNSQTADQATNQDHLLDDQSATHNDKTNQDDLTKSQSNQTNHISDYDETQITNGLTNDQVHQQPEEIRASIVHNVVTEFPFDVTDDHEQNNHKTDLSDKLPPSVDMGHKTESSDKHSNGEVSTLVEDFSGTSTINGCPNQLEPHDTVLLVHTTDGHRDSEGDENVSTVEEMSADKQDSDTLLSDGTINSLVTDDSSHHCSTEHSLQEDPSDEEDSSQNLTPRKHWSSTQLVQSTPDSLNQVHHFDCYNYVESQYGLL